MLAEEHDATGLLNLVVSLARDRDACQFSYGQARMRREGFGFVAEQRDGAVDLRVDRGVRGGLERQQQHIDVLQRVRVCRLN